MDLEVMTLNCWGLWLVSKRRRERIKYLADFLEKHSTADVVVLQEIWVGVDAKLLMESAAKGGLSHSIHFRSGMFGSGLVTLSRYPIVESGFWRYSSAGDPAAISCGDFYAGKGFGWVRINTPCGPVDVFNTHLHANYSHMCKAVSMDMGDEEGGDGVAIMSPKSSGGASPKGLGHDEYRVPGDMAGAYRVNQMLELVQVMRHVSKWGSVGLVLGGDLNTKPDFLECTLLKVLMPELHDSWAVLHADEAGHTCKAPGNTFQPRRQVSERIDYVLSTFVPTKSEILLQMSPGGCSYSDHFAVKAKLTLENIHSDPSTLVMSPRGSSGLDVHAKSFTQGRPTHMDAAHSQKRAVVLKSALGVLRRGEQLNGRNASVNLGLSAVLLFMAIALAIYMAVNASMAPGGTGALPVSMLVPRVAAAIVSLAMAVFAAFFFIMGFIADSTQQRVLQHAVSNLMILLGTY